MDEQPASDRTHERLPLFSTPTRLDNRAQHPFIRTGDRDRPYERTIHHPHRRLTPAITRRHTELQSTDFTNEQSFIRTGD